MRIVMATVGGGSECKEKTSTVNKALIVEIML